MHKTYDKAVFKCSKKPFWYSNFWKSPYTVGGIIPPPTPSPRSIASVILGKGVGGGIPLAVFSPEIFLHLVQNEQMSVG